MYLVLLGCFVWCTIGVGSFIYWWTKKYDFKAVDVPVALVCGPLGPIAFVACWAAVGCHQQSCTLIKRRER
jgi:hypothetical protein